MSDVQETDVNEITGNNPETPEDTAKDNPGTEKEQTGKEPQADNEELFGMPENYDYSNIQLPENVVLDEDMTGQFNEIAKKLNLSQKAADEFMALGVQQVNKINEILPQKIEEYVNNQLEQQKADYKLLLNSDKELGGANLKQTLIDANEAYTAFANDEVMDALSKYGLNNYPPIVKMFRDIGRQLKDDTIHQSGGNKKQRTAADWFPSMQLES